MSQLPTPSLPRPRYSGIPSAGKSGLPAPGSITRSTVGSGGPATGPLNGASPLTKGSNDVLNANGIPKSASRASNASSPTSPDVAYSKPAAFGLPRQSTSASYSKTSFSPVGPRTSIGRPPSSSSATSSRYGEQTVPMTPPRRQSTAYTPSSAVKVGSTPRSVVTSRSESRMSDTYTRDSSRASQRPLEVGDPVKIDSLQLEGTLRFLGEIAGKPGQWAGVELSGKYAGKGKNDGSAGGVAYFSCPPKCGVFVASTKIAPIPIRPPSIRRPGSVASSQGGDTPLLASPTDARQLKVSSKEASLLAQSKISAGSRASKYIGITAKQLSNRDTPSLAKGSPAPASPQKPSAAVFGTQTTPKAPRTSLGLRPRVSIPSLATPKPGHAQLTASKSNEMPPPPVPDKALTPSSSYVTSDDERPFGDLPNISLTNGMSPSPSPSQSARSSMYATPSPEPSFYVVELERLRTLVQTLEVQNQELQQAASVASEAAVASSTPSPAPAPIPQVDESRLQALEEQKSAALQKVAELEALVRTSERSGIEKQSKVETLERLVAETKEDVVKAKAEGEARAKEVKVKLEESEALVSSLKSVIEDKASAASENDAILAAKQAEIEVLQGQVSRITSDLEHDRRELGAHIDELRKAGQETIALYEERISAFEAERYDAEALIESLEEKLKTASVQQSAEELAKQASTAAEIDNETLREQVALYQQRIQHLEDQLEEAQVTVEREEAAIQNRISRYKEKDSRRQAELEEARQLAESAAKSETTAKTRIEELEEALRENTVALEDARAEIEALRTDVTILENSTEASTRSVEGGASDTYATEAKHLKALLDASKLETRATADQLVAVKSQAEESARLVKDLRDLIKSLEKEKADLLKSADSLRRSRDSTGSTSSRTKDDNLRDQISGLKVMNQELQKENSTLTSKIRSIEVENKTLMTEMDDLKETIKTLEQAVDESIQREERMLEEEAQGGLATDESSVLQRTLRETRAEVDQLRKKLTDTEKRTTKTIAELNKEVADLESLVEAKIYREDDLEREVERLKDKVQRLQSKSSSKNTSGGHDLSKSQSRGSHTRSSTVTQQTVTKEEPSSTAVCEICEQAGHDIFSCPLLKEDESATTAPASEIYCVDCNSRTHNTADCPHSQDVF